MVWWEKTRDVDTVDWRRKVSTAGGVPLGSNSKYTVGLLLLVTKIPTYIHSLHGPYCGLPCSESAGAVIFTGAQTVRVTPRIVW